MANDRVMLKCKGCGERFCLLRYFPRGNPKHFLKPSWVIEDFAAWLDAHCEGCHDGLRAWDLEGDPRFVTETE